jgi:hypothetical protein
MQPRLDIAHVAREALAASERLVPNWLPEGRRSGHEWQAPNPTRSDRHVGSFSVNLTTGAWADFATGDKGGDLVALYAYLHGLQQLQAAKEIAGQLGISPRETEPATPKPAPKREGSPWSPVLPAPQGIAPPAAHVARGRPERIWTYRGLDGAVLGFVYRFKTSDGGKEILPLVWGRHAETGAATIRHYIFDARNPKNFYVYPKPSSAIYLEVVYSVAPTDVTESGGTVSGNLALDDIYSNAVLDFILYRAYSKDAEYAQNAQRAAAHFQQFTTSVGARTATDGAVNPNANSVWNPANPMQAKAA